MRKKIYMIIAIVEITLIMAICLVACGNTGNNNYGFNIQGTNLVCIGTKSTFKYGYALYYDKSTKVMYMFVKHGYGAGLTPMYNADGTLKLYEEE